MTNLVPERAVYRPWIFLFELSSLLLTVKVSQKDMPIGMETVCVRVCVCVCDMYEYL